MTASEPLVDLDGAGRTRDRYRGALLGTAVGDGLGAPFEGHRSRVSAHQITSVELDHRPLRHTDDTTMTIALAESLLYVDGLDQDHLALTFTRHWEREPDRGYGAGTTSLLARISAGTRWKDATEAQFDGQGSFGNGAAMRIAPVALWAAGDPVLAAHLARRSAAVTHTHPLAVDGAAVQAVAVTTALAHSPTAPIDPVAFLNRLRDVAGEETLAQRLDVVGALIDEDDVADDKARLGTGIEAHEAVPTAIYCFLCHPDSFRDTIRLAISLGGDTDTIAAMAGAIAGARLGERAIPASWVDRTEAAPTVRHLADRFVARRLRPRDRS
jgi:poly(ADP-ribose) glycohydrolase ARH3